MIRMREGLEMWRLGCWDFLLVTGGVFTSRKIMTMPGAKVMADWFVDQGVPRNKIMIEGRSRDTYQNVEFTIGVIRDRFLLKKVKITVVTQWQHAIRFWLTFRSWGIKVALRKLHYPMGVVGIIREFVFIAVTAIDPKGKIVGRANQCFFRQHR